MKKNFLLMGSMAVLGFAFTSCSKDLYDENAVFDQKDATYTANFEKRYGKIDPNQTWDFTTSTPTVTPVSSSTGTRAVSSAAEANFLYTQGTMYIQKEISEYMFDKLPKGQNNSAMGKRFTMQIGENDFTIVPIFQGCASYYWELWMHVDGVGEKRIWCKGDLLSFRKAGTTGDFKNVGYNTDGMKAEDGPFEVQAPTYTFNNLPTGAAMTFYLRVWTGGHSQYLKYQANPLADENQPIEKSSVELKMLDLEGAPVPNGLPEGYTATIIGCEDGNDQDFEDLVFMVYGKPVPPTQRVEKVIQQESKRYIMEDLGDTDDFDFNDVVFDIYYDRVLITYIYNNANDTQPASTKRESLPNIGIVRAAGGIYNFDIKIGGKSVWSKSSATTIKTTDMVNTQSGYNPNYVLGEFDATGYNARTNNVSVTVDSKGDTETVYTIPFPEKGKAPKIVAVPVLTDWMTERTKVPTTWFTSAPASDSQGNE